jgi:hypothetical protein
MLEIKAQDHKTDLRDVISNFSFVDSEEENEAAAYEDFVRDFKFFNENNTPSDQLKQSATWKRES